MHLRTMGDSTYQTIVTLRGKVYKYSFILKAFSGSEIVYFGEMKHWRWYVVPPPHTSSGKSMFPRVVISLWNVLSMKTNVSDLNDAKFQVNKSLKIPKGNQNLWIKGQTSQWHKEKVQNDKPRSTKYTHKIKIEMKFLVAYGARH